MKPYHQIRPRRPIKSASSAKASTKVGQIVLNIFCPTGKGGGIDPTCGHGKSGSGVESGASGGASPSLSSKPMFSDAENSLPKAALQPVAPDAGYKKLAEVGEVANNQLKALLDLGKGIGSQLGYSTVLPKNDDEIVARAKEPGGFVLLAPIKSERRSTEKVNSDYGGDWRKLGDIARASVVVDTVGELHTVIGKLRESGISFAKAPKDRINNPTEVGYRDLMTHLKMPNGVVVELQLHLKPMIVAKAEGHKHYETMRTLDAKKGNGGKLTPEEQRQYDKAVSESKQIYETAWNSAITSMGK